jgi:hypothetical protein
MATRVVNTSPENTHGDSPRKIPPCSICEGDMVVAYDRYQQKVCVCTDCHTSITIPGAAWAVATLKREAQKQQRAATDRRRAGRRAGDIGLQS